MAWYCAAALSASRLAMARRMAVVYRLSTAAEPGTRSKKLPGTRADMERSTLRMRGESAASTTAAWKAIVARWNRTRSSSSFRSALISSSSLSSSGRLFSTARRAARQLTVEDQATDVAHRLVRARPGPRFGNGEPPRLLLLGLACRHGYRSYDDGAGAQ